MGGLFCNRLAREASTEWRSRTFLALVPCLALLMSSGAHGDEIPLMRSVLGTVLTADKLEIARQPGAWEPGGQGSPVIEDSSLRTEGGQPALVGLGKHGLVSLRNASSLHVGRTEGNDLPLSVGADSEISFRMPASTGMYFVTDSAVVSALAAGPGTGEDAYIQGVIQQQDGETTVHVISGSLRVRNLDGVESTVVASGEEVRIASASTPPLPVGATAEGEKKRRRRLGGFAFLGTKTGLITAGVVGVAAIGGGVAVAASSSGGGGSDSNANQGGGGQASAFTP